MSADGLLLRETTVWDIMKTERGLPMYCTEDLKEIERRVARFTFVYVCLVALLLAAVTVSCVLRIAWFGYIASILLALVSVFLWGTYGLALTQYRSFLRDLLQSRGRKVCGKIEYVDTEVSTQNGLKFYAVYIREPDASVDAAPRLLYFDAYKGRPHFSEGQEICVSLFDKYIKAIL